MDLIKWLFSIIFRFLTKYKEDKSAIKENSEEMKSDLKPLLSRIKGMKPWKWVLIVLAVLSVVTIIVVCVNRQRKEPEPFQEIALLNDRNKVVYPIGVDILNESQIGEYTFFRYNVTEEYKDVKYTYPVLYKWKKGELAERISERACPHFEIAHNTVIYLDTTIGDLSHGQLYVARPDGKSERVLEQELYQFSVVNDYIYFIYCYDTVGAGLEGHALHRMDINGDNIITVAYEVCGPGLRGSKYNFKIEDGWAVYSNYKIKIGGQADGLEKVVLLDNTKEDWIYYTSNKLIKARPDGTEQVVLDDGHSTYFWIDRIEDGWIYYYNGDAMYKIDINGNNKEMIEY